MVGEKDSEGELEGLLEPGLFMYKNSRQEIFHLHLYILLSCLGFNQDFIIVGSFNCCSGGTYRRQLEL